MLYTHPDSPKKTSLLLIVNTTHHPHQPIRYLQNGACVTLGDIYEARAHRPGPVYPFDERTQSIAANVTGSWYLASSLYVTQGSTLLVQGTAFGGDCDHLLMESSPDKFINLRAHGGDIWIEGTHVESWDLGAGHVDEDDGDGRRCVCVCCVRV